jgi:CheY-like chemotaxis protein
MLSCGSAARIARATVRPPRPLSSTTMGASVGDMYRQLSDQPTSRLDNYFPQKDPVGTNSNEDHTMANPLDGKRILLVDDDNDILTSMQAAFEPTGAVIESANNGQSRRRTGGENQPDLIILDMMLPGRSGFMVLEKVKSKKAAKQQALRHHDHGQHRRPPQDVRREPGRERLLQ